MGNQRWENWSKTVSSSPESIIYPNTQDELIESIRIAISNNTKVKIVGSGHSCSKIAETHTGILIALNNLKNIINYDKELLQLEVQSGATLKSINNYLSNSGCLTFKSRHYRFTNYFWSYFNRYSWYRY